MTQRKPGDYVVSAELTDEQRERFVADCVAAGAGDDKDYYGQKYTWFYPCGSSVGVGLGIFGDEKSRDCTHEYKARPKTQPQLMRQIADAMERNPEGWFMEFQLWSCDTESRMWINCHTPTAIWRNAMDGNYHAIRPKPRTHTLNVQEMPEPLREAPEMGSELWFIAPESQCVLRDEWGGAMCDWRRLRSGLCYPDEPTAREALEKLTRAMGGE